MNDSLRIALACSGIGHISRGYEASVLEIFEATVDSPHKIRLFRGGRREKVGKWCPTVSRCSRLYDFPIFRRVSRYRRYWLENCLFGVFLIIRITFKPVDIVFTPDHIVASLLDRFQSLIPRRPSVIFSNGAPFENEFCKRFKYVHQKSKAHFHPEEAPDSKMFLIGNGFNTALFRKPSNCDQNELRRNFALPSDKRIVLCLAALNAEHKRVDWIIDEIAKLDHRFHLVLCGQECPGTPDLRKYAEVSGAECTFTEVPMTKVPQLLWASDIMVLGSLSEGFPRVIAEAMASETPILVHPHENARWILGEESKCFADMTISGELATKIIQWSQGGEPTRRSVASNCEKIRREFSRNKVLPQYLSMFEQVGQDRRHDSRS